MSYDLEELARLCAAATPGEWSVRFQAVRCAGQSRDLGGWLYSADAQLVVAARNALPALIARVRELEAERARALDPPDPAAPQGLSEAEIAIAEEQLYTQEPR